MEYKKIELTEEQRQKVNEVTVRFALEDLQEARSYLEQQMAQVSKAHPEVQKLYQDAWDRSNKLLDYSRHHDLDSKMIKEIRDFSADWLSPFA